MVPKCFAKTALRIAGIVSLLLVTNEGPLAGTISIAPDVPTLSASEDEAEGVLYPFTVTNTSAVNDPFPNIVISAVRLPASIPAIAFVKGDRNDEVSSTMIVHGALNICETPNVILRPGDTCSFQQLIITQDLNKPASDNDSGTWQVFNVVDFFDRAGILSSTGGSGMVEVTDLAVPEPTGLPVLVFSIVSLLCVTQITRSRWSNAQNTTWRAPLKLRDCVKSPFWNNTV